MDPKLLSDQCNIPKNLPVVNLVILTEYTANKRILPLKKRINC